MASQTQFKYDYKDRLFYANNHNKKSFKQS